MKRYFGILAALTSAFIFGVTPILGKLSYEGGGNGIMPTFLRVAVLDPAMTTVLPYSSYQYISTGIATVLQTGMLSHESQK